MSGFITGIGPAFKGILQLLNFHEKFAKNRRIEKDADINDAYESNLDALDNILPK